MPQVKIVPVPGRLILNPSRNYQPVPEDGCTVELDAFWTRVLQDGDVAIAPAKVVETKTAEAAFSPEVAPAASNEFRTNVVK